MLVRVEMSFSFFFFKLWTLDPVVLCSLCRAILCYVISYIVIVHSENVTILILFFLPCAWCQSFQTWPCLNISNRLSDPDIHRRDWLHRVRVSVSTPSAGANDETGPPRPADDVDHQVKGAVARPVSTGCPTVEPELNRRFDGEWERNGMRDGGCELVSKIRGRIST